MDALSYLVKDLIFTTYKKHISRKSRWRDMESIDRKEVAWSYLDANNAEMYIKYSIETPNGLQRDLFKLKLSEIRKWIDMRKNNAKLFVTFIEQPNTINFYYKSYPYFTFDFDNVNKKQWGLTHYFV